MPGQAPDFELKVLSKRVTLISGFLNLSFELDVIDSAENVMHGILKASSESVLVGCTDRGRLCIMGDASDDTWLSEDLTITLYDYEGNEVVSFEVTPESLLTDGGGDDDRTSNIVGIGCVGFMIITGA